MLPSPLCDKPPWLSEQAATLPSPSVARLPPWPCRLLPRSAAMLLLSALSSCSRLNLWVSWKDPPGRCTPNWGTVVKAAAELAPPPHPPMLTKW